MEAYIYPISLLAISAVFMVAEWLVPWRPEQKQLRPGLASDLLHIVFNGHFLGVILYGIATYHVLPHADPWLRELGLFDTLHRSAAQASPLWVQIAAVLIGLDFIHWLVHNLLHRVPFLWQFHQTHHSVVDGEMDFWVSFRFQWTEVVVYKSLQYVPLAFFAFAPEAILFHAIFGTIIGHLNHSNLDVGYGPWRYVLNSPRMHIWHHDYDADAKTTVNFGIIFSAWDWIFGTAKMPDHPPRHIGFRGVEQFPKGFFAQAAWPISGWIGQNGARRVIASALGALLLFAGWLFAAP